MMKRFFLHVITIMGVLLSQTIHADFVIIDDLIVDGSACVGFDCSNGESFGFDTIRLKENNLRIKFDDTSVAAAFPRNDWQLTANDSANGGTSKFSIDDITGNRTPFTVEANAASHSLYVDDGSRIGNGTSTPSTEIHSIDGDTPSLRLQQNGSSGFSPQTWDVAGNETNFFIRDVTNGSQLPLRIRPGAPTSSVFIDEDGEIGLGTSSPEANLHIEDSDGQVQLILESTGANSAVWQVVMDHDGAANPGLSLTRTGTGVRELRIDHNGNLFVNGTISSAGTVLNVPDYVFGSGYQLLPLDKLKDFIETNRHLPNIPSQGEVLANGTINMTEMQMRLLEKIEELTLYTLAQEERIREIEKRLETAHK